MRADSGTGFAFRSSPEIPAHYNVLRLSLPNAETFTAASFKGISSHLITSPITGMFLTSTCPVTAPQFTTPFCFNAQPALTSFFLFDSDSGGCWSHIGHPRNADFGAPHDPFHR